MYLPSTGLVPTQAKTYWIWLHCSSLFTLPPIASRWYHVTMTLFIPPEKAQRVAMDNLPQEPSFLQAWKGPHSSWLHSSTVMTWECFQRVVKNCQEATDDTQVSISSSRDTVKIISDVVQYLQDTETEIPAQVTCPRWASKGKAILGNKTSSLRWHI